MTTNQNLPLSFRRIFLILMCILSLVGGWLSLQSSPSSEHAIKNCFGQSLSCKIPRDREHILVSLARKPRVEEIIDVHITMPANMPINKAWIEGVNMYMGKIPLPLEQTAPQHWHGWFMLGSCSEPQMEWELNLILQDEPMPVSIRFFTAGQ